MLVRVAGGGQIRRHDLEKQFRVSATTAKRDLQALTKAGRIEFVGAPKTGHYRRSGTHH